MGDTVSTPTHVAIIMDGNRRWAKNNKLAVVKGHSKGAKNVMDIVKAAAQLGIKTLTLFAFSTENWNRSKAEVSALLRLFKNYLKSKVEEMVENGVSLKIIGDLSVCSKDLLQAISSAQTRTKDCKKIQLVIAFNYGGRDEMVRAIKNIITHYPKNKIDEALIASCLDTQGFEDPQLLIRTSGEQRISNFLLWQLAYTELYFTNVFWPDFSPEDLKTAVECYKTRKRTYGK